MNRERKVASKLLEGTNRRIEQRTPAYLMQKNRMTDFNRNVIQKQLGLFKKLTTEERMLHFSQVMVDKKKLRQA